MSASCVTSTISGEMGVWKSYRFLGGKGEFVWLNQGSWIRDGRRRYKGPGAVVSLLYGDTELGREWKLRREIQALAGR